MRQEFHNGRIVLHGGDCLDVLKTLADNSLDSCVTDPPYHLTSIVKRFGTVSREDDTSTSDRARRGADGMARLSRGFMGKQWDGGDIAFRVELWAEVFRVLKPGAHLVAFSGTRTYHRMACAIEDAGFEMRDMISWLYGSGFPKSHDVSKGIDKAFGAEREKIRVDASNVRNPKATGAGRDGMEGATRPWIADALARGYHEAVSDEAVSDEAVRWQGWGTALKPACEPIAFARKPLSEKTVAANVLKHGTGAIHVDACRVATDEIITNHGHSAESGKSKSAFGDFAGIAPHQTEGQKLGRWPANIVHDGSDEVVSAFPQTNSGEFLPHHKAAGGSKIGTFDIRDRSGEVHPTYGDSGSAARFFYSAKADADDRIGSKHPTVKPVDLMRWLVRLVTPKGGTILEPFAGTGTTGAAAFLEGFNAVLIEREAEYQADIARRMALLLAGPDERARESLKARGKDQGHDDLPLFIPTPAPKAKQEAMDI